MKQRGKAEISATQDQWWQSRAREGQDGRICDGSRGLMAPPPDNDTENSEPGVYRPRRTATKPSCDDRSAEARRSPHISVNREAKEAETTNNGLHSVGRSICDLHSSTGKKGARTDTRPNGLPDTNQEGELPWGSQMVKLRQGLPAAKQQKNWGERDPNLWVKHRMAALATTAGGKTIRQMTVYTPHSRQRAARNQPTVQQVKAWQGVSPRGKKYGQRNQMAHATRII